MGKWYQEGKETKQRQCQAEAWAVKLWFKPTPPPPPQDTVEICNSHVRNIPVSVKRMEAFTLLVKGWSWGHVNSQALFFSLYINKVLQQPKAILQQKDIDASFQKWKQVCMKIVRISDCEWCWCSCSNPLHTLSILSTPQLQDLCLLTSVCLWQSLLVAQLTSLLPIFLNNGILMAP